MGTNGPNDVTMSTADEIEDFVEIKIKTLDSQTYRLRVNKFVSVPALKEQIATVTGVLSEQQRLICRGKVLKDDQLLSAYHVEDGHTLHLVSRQPISTSSAPTMGSEDATGHQDTSASNSAQNHGNSISHSFVIEAINIDQGDRSSPTLGRFVSSLLNSIAAASAVTGNARVDPREMGSERPDRAYSNVRHSDASHTQPRPAVPRVEHDPRQAAFQFPSTLNMGFQHPLVIYDSLTTIHQYLRHMRDEFRREASEDIGGELNDNLESSGTHVNGEEIHTSQPRSVSMPGYVPSPTSLAEIMISARELLIDQAGGRLFQLARQLENQASVTDPSLRSNIQSSAVRSGLLLQNLGSLLLELGRTTMTLRMGQTPTEAVVNAGPAVFISSSGPNPLMVQPIPFYPFNGLQTVTANPLHGPEAQSLDPAHVPRNIDIRIHTGGHTVPIASANLGEQADPQQTQEQADSVRNSPRTNFIRQAFPGVSAGASLAGEPSIRMVPIRTVVAVPAGVNRSASDASGRAGILYPLFARIQQQHTVNTTDARGPQSSTDPHSGGSETDRQTILESSMPARDPGLLPTNPAAVLSGTPSATTGSVHHQGPSRIYISRQNLPTGNIDSSQYVDGQHSVQGSVSQMLSRFDQWLRNTLTGEEVNASENGLQGQAAGSTSDHTGTTRNSEAQESSIVDDQAVFFSNLVRRLMPYISQGTDTVPGTSTAQSEESPAEPSSSRHRRDPPESPSSKRPKRS